MKPIIKVENLSKQYRLGNIGTGTLGNDLKRWWHQLRGKEDPFLKIGETNDRTTKGNSEYAWALKDINFEVMPGEVLGIIGKNGAGKSTLLKILSKVTGPTTGRIDYNGRIGSLLEVGTGFHPELTGRENIFLNGAILGMTKREIRSKLDEIIDFSGCERYIDTPVKRYSSGMTVRLGFAVAAHLEPEILIVDEVLAVGDAEFQKKAIGKMQDVSRNEGRTVLFVSHNMAAVQNVCAKSLLLKHGSVDYIDKTESVINKYLSLSKIFNLPLTENPHRKGSGVLKFTDCFINKQNMQEPIGVEALSDFKIDLYFQANIIEQIRNYRIDIGINNNLGDRIAWLSTDSINGKVSFESGKISFIIHQLPLAPGEYDCNLYCEINNEISDWLSNVIRFTVLEKDYYSTGKLIPNGQGNLLLNYTMN